MQIDRVLLLTQCHMIRCQLNSSEFSNCPTIAISDSELSQLYSQSMSIAQKTCFQWNRKPANGSNASTSGNTESFYVYPKKEFQKSAGQAISMENIAIITTPVPMTTSPSTSSTVSGWKELENAIDIMMFPKSVNLQDSNDVVSKLFYSYEREVSDAR